MHWLIAGDALALLRCEWVKPLSVIFLYRNINLQVFHIKQASAATKSIIWQHFTECNQPFLTNRLSSLL